ncbi:Uncharacterised protein [Metamycoplasma cloacale]|uniref:Uncharacterized protein n=1 Tax=Metamycoplasma cloacale TaxID=92401 RepID=A0A2Z4LLF5_9BACT|nr:hypothetical protein [Metamycoplasma cloacale]AWX42484.1 hypothetical protein DK849_00065 [Metamycoplasma cloacale]VEU79170.1 Uncharacterised protein [Metamycoplasma cloacale]
MKTKVKTKTNINELLTTEELKRGYSCLSKWKLFCLITNIIAAIILIIVVTLYIIYKHFDLINFLFKPFVLMIVVASLVIQLVVFNSKFYDNIKNVLAYLYAKTNLKRFKHWFAFVFISARAYTYKKHKKEWLKLVEKYKSEELIEKNE